MAITQNTFTGDGSNLGPFSFTFKWLEPTDIKVTVAGVLKTVGTHYNLQSLNYTTKTGGQVLFTAGNAPANGAAIVIYRQTDDTDLAATFYSGSAIRAQDLNNNFVQGLYVTQESSNNATTAIGTANTALTNSSTAISTANTALSTANTASSNASAAVSTANTASSNASAAVSTANTASTNATTAVNTANAATATANSAASNAATALSTANAATSTANAASTAATNAVNTANAASSAASSAVSTANTASTNASNAVTTANTASTNATTAVNTANAATVTANAAAAAVANAVLYTTVANVAAIPATPANNTAVEVTNSTGIESFTPLSGLPVGFVGSSGLSVRIIYQTAGTTWTWIQYFPNDPENRYLKEAGDTMTGALGVTAGTAAAPSIFVSGDTNTGIYSPGADQVAISTNGTGRLLINDSGQIFVAATAISGDSLNANGFRFGSGSIKQQSTVGFDFTQFYTSAGQAFPDASIFIPSSNAFGIKTSGNERLRITSAGLVGVGTSSPTELLHVVGSGTATIRVATSDTTGAAVGRFRAVYPGGGGGATSAVDLRAGDGYGYLLAENNVPLLFGTNNTERLRIDSSGRVGIGTSTPNSKLSVIDGAVECNQFFYNAISSGLATASRGLLFNIDGTSYGRIYAPNGKSVAIQAGAGTLTDAVTVDQSGRVGIGTTSPTSTLTSNGTVHITGAGTPASGAGLEIGYGSAAASTTSLISYNRTGSAWLDADYRSLTHQFFTSGSERARIDSSGRLLIGTSTARSVGGQSHLVQLESVGSSPFSGISAVNNANDINGSYLILGKSRGTSVGSNTVVQNGDQVGGVFFAAADGSSINATAATITCNIDAAPSAGDTPGRLVFSTTADGASSPTERVRITNLGQFNAFSANNVSTILGRNSAGAGTTVATYIGAHSATGTTDGTVSCYIWSNGNIQNTNGSYTTISDAKLKENIVDAGSQWDDFKAIQIRNWNFKAETGHETHRQIGPIAQELETVCPGLVFETPDRDVDGNETGEVTKGVNQSVLYMKAVKALQEAMERIEQLEAKKAAQQTVLDNLLARVTALETA